MAGAPTKRTPENERIILEAVRLGLSIRAALKAVGMSHTTLDDWKRDNPEFLAAIEREQEAGKIARLDQINRAARQDWKAAAWIQTHCYPDEFSDKRVVQIEGQPSPYDLMIQIVKQEQADEAAVDSVAADEGETE